MPQAKTSVLRHSHVLHDGDSVVNERDELVNLVLGHFVAEFVDERAHVIELLVDIPCLFR